jgi:hypothetical protein
MLFLTVGLSKAAICVHNVDSISIVYNIFIVMTCHIMFIIDPMFVFYVLHLF